MAIRRLNGNRFSKGDRSTATVSTLPTVRAMLLAFDRYLNLTIASGNASNDTIKIYRNRMAQFLYWCKDRELYPALITKEISRNTASIWLMERKAVPRFAYLF